MASSKPATTIGDNTEPLRELVAAFLDRYPLSIGKDIYRLVYLGTCGDEFCGKDSGQDREALLKQMQADAEAASNEGSISESVSIDGEVLRVNLGPFFAAGGDLGALADAVLVLRSGMKQRRDQLFTFWAGFMHMNRRHEFRLNREELEHFEMIIASSGYPLLPHSAEYVEAYNPRYVLCMKSDLPASPGQ